MQIEDKDTYIKKLLELLEGCFVDEGQHAVLVVGNDATRIMGLYAVNANNEQVGSLVTAAASYVIEDATTERVIN